MVSLTLQRDRCCELFAWALDGRGAGAELFTGSAQRLRSVEEVKARSCLEISVDYLYYHDDDGRGKKTQGYALFFFLTTSLQRLKYQDPLVATRQGPVNFAIRRQRASDARDECALSCPMRQLGRDKTVLHRRDEAEELQRESNTAKR